MNVHIGNNDPAAAVQWILVSVLTCCTLVALLPGNTLTSGTSYDWFLTHGTERDWEIRFGGTALIGIIALVYPLLWLRILSLVVMSMAIGTLAVGFEIHSVLNWTTCCTAPLVLASWLAIAYMWRYT